MDKDQSTKVKHSGAISMEMIERRIYFIRSQKIMLDRDLAELYGVKPIALRQQVKRNLNRFPADFVFRLSRKESEILVSQSVIPSKRSLGGFLPYAFTEQGVAMLSSVLRSDRAVLVNIAIMRAFVRLRQLLARHRDLARKLEQMEKQYDGQFRIVFDAIRKLMEPPPASRRPPLGFIKGK